jgi:hypothetical protein
MAGDPRSAVAGMVGAAGLMSGSFMLVSPGLSLKMQRSGQRTDPVAATIFRSGDSA